MTESLNVYTECKCENVSNKPRVICLPYRHDICRLYMSTLAGFFNITGRFNVSGGFKFAEIITKKNMSDICQCCIYRFNAKIDHLKISNASISNALKTKEMQRRILD